MFASTIYDPMRACNGAAQIKWAYIYVRIYCIRGCFTGKNYIIPVAWPNPSKCPYKTYIHSIIRLGCFCCYTRVSYINAPRAYTIKESDEPSELFKIQIACLFMGVHCGGCAKEGGWRSSHQRNKGEVYNSRMCARTRGVGLCITLALLPPPVMIVQLGNHRRKICFFKSKSLGGDDARTIY